MTFILIYLLHSRKESIREWTNYNENHEVFVTMVPLKWEYSQDRPYKGDTIKSERRMYLHLYYNGEKALEQERRFATLLLKLQKELQEGKLNPEHTRLYDKYFLVHETQVRGIKVPPKQKAIDAVKKNYGFFALISNQVKDPNDALDIYRNRDLVEKAFGNLKERMNIRRLLVS